MKHLERLKEIVRILREPGGCDWDRTQTIESMRRHLLEETYEAVEAASSDDSDHVKEELGDVLFIIFFYARLYEEKNLFSIGDIAEEISEKLVRRHPHVFGNVQVAGVEEILANWEKIKKSEKKNKGVSPGKSILNGVDGSLPALMYSEKIQEKASKAGFDWPDASGNIEKIKEEISELSDAVNGGIQKEIEEEIGDLFFALVNLSRKCRIHPETALRLSARKFISRFQMMEAEAEKTGLHFESLSIGEKENLWQTVKEKNA